MKHSVNNKTFDEIFAQRGEQVQPENMVRHRVYFWHDYDCPDLRLLLRFKDFGRWELYSGLALFDNGNFSEGVSYEWEDSDTFFEATPDQVELLNSYRV